jgi:NAD(P)H-dependent FMN reductase
MTTLLGIPGSLRKGSFNRALLTNAADLLPDGAQLEIAGLEGIPLYDGDLEEAQGIPDAVSALKDRIAAADGVIIATPEYNGSMPGVLKNAVDWLSRPPQDQARVFHHRPVAMLGATPGGLGTILSQDAWLGVVRTLRMRPYFEGRLLVSGAHKLLDEDGRLTDDKTVAQLRDFVGGFVEFVRG